MHRGPLVGLQWVSYADLAMDIRNWSRQITQEYAAVSGIPRSGLTCAHMLAVQLNLPCFPLGESQTFRQSTGRSLQHREGKILVVDDACSYGTTINEARALCRQRGISADFAAIYSRDVSRHLLEHHPYYHADPDFLVIFEWNWMYHQDRGYVGVSRQCLDFGLRHTEGFGGVFDEDDPDLIKKIKDSKVVVVFLTHRSLEIACQGFRVVDIRTGELRA